MRTIAALAAGALLLGGCANEDVEPVPLTDVSPSPAASPSASAEAVPDDPYAVPDEITPEYVEKVYAALAKLEAEAIEAYRTHVENGGAPDLPPREAVDRFRAIYSESYFPARMAAWSEMASSERGFSGFREDLGQAFLDVQDLLFAGDRCLVVEGVLDLTHTAKSMPESDVLSVFAFVPAAESTALNPTPWEIAFNVLSQSFTMDPDRPCRD